MVMKFLASFEMTEIDWKVKTVRKINLGTEIATSETKSKGLYRDCIQRMAEQKEIGLKVDAKRA